MIESVSTFTQEAKVTFQLSTSLKITLLTISWRTNHFFFFFLHHPPDAWEDKCGHLSSWDTDLPVVSEVGFAERSRAVQARFVSFQLPSNAGVTGHLSGPGKLPGIRARRSHPAGVRTRTHDGSPRGGPSTHRQALELRRNLRQHPVDAHLGPFGVALLAHGADELLAVVPVALQAGLAEAVAARRGNGLHKHLQTDGAAELLLREESASRGAHACRDYDHMISHLSSTF